MYHFYQVTEEHHTKVVENFANKSLPFDYQETSFYYDSPNGPKSVQTLEHWLQRCPNLDLLRKHTFGSPSLVVLTADPEKVLAPGRAPSRPYAPASTKTAGDVKYRILWSNSIRRLTLMLRDACSA